MTDAKSLAEAVEKAGFTFSTSGNESDEFKSGLWNGYVRGATDPDSPLLRKALELLDYAMIVMEGEEPHLTVINTRIKEIRECQEAYK